MEKLSVALTLVNILFLVGVGANDYKLICYIIGVVLHYLWLTVFSFMTVVVLDIGHNIRSRKHNIGYLQNDSLQKRYLTLIGLAIPLLIVIPSVILDQYHISMFACNYGGKICFPSSYPANLFFCFRSCSL